MIKINKVNNSLTVEGVDNVFYPNNGNNSYPLNSLIVVTDNSDMATFRSVATNDVLFSGLIKDITINGEAVTKDNIITKFDAVSNSSTGGGGSTVDAYTKEEADNKFASKDELTNVQTVANDADTKVDALTTRVEGVETTMGNKQDTLVSGTNIKTINNQSILGEGNIEISDYYTKTEADEIFATTTQVNHQAADISALQTDMRGKQATLVSGENIKTINSESILGTGDIQINGVSDEQAQEIAKIPTLETEIAQKANVSDVPTVQTDRYGTNKNYVYSEGEIDNYKGVMSKLEVGYSGEKDVLLSYHLWNSTASHSFAIPTATTSKAGVMSAADKTKLDSIPETIPSQSEIDGIAADVSALESDMANKQPTLVSGTNIKTINGESVLGEGNVEVAKKTDIPSTDNLATKDELTAVETIANNAATKADTATSRVESVETALNNKQDTLVSGTNIKTINSQSILGEGNIEISGGISEEQAQEIAKIPTLETALNNKQDTLVSGTNIKTINGNSILGEGNLVIEGGGIDLSNYYTKTETDTKLDTKQNTLVSGTNIKTINGESVIGEGNIVIEGSGGIKTYEASEIPSVLLKELKEAVSNAISKKDYSKYTTTDVTPISQFLSNLSNGDYLKLYNDNGYKLQFIGNKIVGTDFYYYFNIIVVGPGNTKIYSNYITITVLSSQIYVGNNKSVEVAKITDIPNTDNFATKDELNNKQDTLVSGTNIKTVNSQSILGEGNIEVTIPDATTATSGAMSAADKTKLDSLSTEWTGTQAEYDALTTKEDNIIYYVTE